MLGIDSDMQDNQVIQLVIAESQVFMVMYGFRVDGKIGSNQELLQDLQTNRSNYPNQ